jgi:hypothetical protein
MICTVAWAYEETERVQGREQSKVCEASQPDLEIEDTAAGFRPLEYFVVFRFGPCSFMSIDFANNSVKVT